MIKKYFPFPVWTEHQNPPEIHASRLEYSLYKVRLVVFHKVNKFNSSYVPPEKAVCEFLKSEKNYL